MGHEVVCGQATTSAFGRTVERAPGGHPAEAA
jgi:hypothetical protein